MEETDRRWMSNDDGRWVVCGRLDVVDKFLEMVALTAGGEGGGWVVVFGFSFPLDIPLHRTGALVRHCDHLLEFGIASSACLDRADIPYIARHSVLLVRMELISSLQVLFRTVCRRVEV